MRVTVIPAFLKIRRWWLKVDFGVVAQMLRQEISP